MADDWSVPVVGDFLKGVLQRKATRMREEKNLGRLSFLRDNGDGHSLVERQRMEIEASDTVDRIDADLQRLERKRKQLEDEKVKRRVHLQ
ncbi:MAG: hypothetical protein LN417_04175 [Candidatus Thermoplasmatota archaeon]|nr:hypothetical protein [Candidatus Thermoplasmatota archaeon]